MRRQSKLPLQIGGSRALKIYFFRLLIVLLCGLAAVIFSYVFSIVLNSIERLQSLNSIYQLLFLALISTVVILGIPAFIYSRREYFRGTVKVTQAQTEEEVNWDELPEAVLEVWKAQDSSNKEATGKARHNSINISLARAINVVFFCVGTTFILTASLFAPTTFIRAVLTNIGSVLTATTLIITVNNTLYQNQGSLAKDYTGRQEHSSLNTMLTIAVSIMLFCIGITFILTASLFAPTSFIGAVLTNIGSVLAAMTPIVTVNKALNRRLTSERTQETLLSPRELGKVGIETKARNPKNEGF